MLFVVTLIHTPELCFGNKQYQEEGKSYIQNMKKMAEKLKVKVHAVYISPNEHTFYFILETDDFKALSEFLGPPILTHCSAKITPVITGEEAFGLPFIKTK